MQVQHAVPGPACRPGTTPAPGSRTYSNDFRGYLPGDMHPRYDVYESDVDARGRPWRPEVDALLEPPAPPGDVAGGDANKISPSSPLEGSAHERRATRSSCRRSLPGPRP